MKRSNVVRLDAYRQDEAKRRIVELLIEQGERETAMETERAEPTSFWFAVSLVVSAMLLLAVVLR